MGSDSIREQRLSVVEGGGRCITAQRNGVPKKKSSPREWPANAALERELLGALFAADQPALAFERLQEKDFHDELHRRLFTALKAAHAAGKPFQTGGWLAQLIRDWTSDERLVAAEILRVGGISAHIPYYCTELRELRRKRATVQIGMDLSKAAGDPQTTSAQWVEQANEWLKKLETVKQLTQERSDD